MKRRPLLFAGAGLLAGCGKPQPAARRVPAGAPVLALGDSLTHGTGAPPEAAYPAVLTELSGWAVANGGVPGDTAAQALARLPGLLQATPPQLVLVGIGGNDLLRRLPERETQATIRRICTTARDAGAQLLLIAVPRPSLVGKLAGALADHPMYAELADEQRIPLHADGWSKVLSDATLRADDIHANAAGYRRFAEGLRDTARRVGLLA